MQGTIVDQATARLLKSISNTTEGDASIPRIELANQIGDEESIHKERINGKYQREDMWDFSSYMVDKFTILINSE